MNATFRGLVYVKHGAVGTKSEGPEYFLQTRDGDYLLAKESAAWKPDYHLEFYQRRMVEVYGEVDHGSRRIHVSQISEILSPLLPQNEPSP